MKENEKLAEGQGTEEATAGNGKVQQLEEKVHQLEEATKKAQKVSASYTLRAIGENAKKLNDLKLITAEEWKTIQEIQEKAITAYIKTQMSI